VVGWKFYCKRESKLHLQVWRKRNDQYKLIGDKKVKTKVGKNKIELDDEIEVKEGDYFGWKFEGLSSVPFDYVDDSSVVWDNYPNTNNYKLKEKVTFSGGQNRLYSIKPVLE
jgi:hypothetical protein